MQPMRVALTRGLGRVLISGTLLTILAILVVVPLLTLIYASFLTGVPFSGETGLSWTLAHYQALWSRQMADATINTIITSLGGAVIAMIFGCGMAWLAARTDIPFKPLVHLAGLMPLFVSLLVASITWSLLAAGRTGYLNIILDSLGIPFRVNVQSLGGIAFVYGLYYAPYPYIFLYSALSLIHPDLEDAASVHGGALARVLNKITFPLVKPAVTGSLLLIIVLMAEDFPVPQILGAPVGIETLSIRIFHLVSQIPPLPNEAAALSIALTGMVCCLVFIQRWVLKGRDYRTVTGKGVQARLIPLGRWRGIAVGIVGLYAFVAVGLPLFALLQGSLRTHLFIPNAAALFDISHFSLQALTNAITDPHVQEALTNSLLAGAITAVVGACLFFVLAYVVNRTDLPGHRSLEYLAMVPLALPALVMALGILWTWVSLPLPVYGTLAILVIAFLTRFMPQGYRAISSSVSQIHNDLEDAAQVAGAGRVTVVRRIVLPLVRGAVVSSAFLILVLSIRELTASLFLYTTRTRVLSIVIYETYESGSWSVVASISIIYTALLVTLTLAGRRWMQIKL